MKQYFYSLTKKAVVTRYKVKIFLWLERKAVLNSYQDIYFLIINPNDQEQIHNIHYYIYIISSSKHDKKFLLISYRFHWILFIECLKHLLFNKTTLYLLIIILATTFLFRTFAFLCLPLIYQEWIYVFGLNQTNSSTATLPVSSLILSITKLFESSSNFEIGE